VAVCRPYLRLEGVLDAAGSVRGIHPKLVPIVQGSWHRKEPGEISGSGYVVHSLEAAVWSFGTTDSFEAAILRAANLGDDADTTAAVTGQLAGAFYGRSGIPEGWLDRPHDVEAISKLDLPPSMYPHPKLGCGREGFRVKRLNLSRGVPEKFQLIRIVQVGPLSRQKRYSSTRSAL